MKHVKRLNDKNNKHDVWGEYDVVDEMEDDDEEVHEKEEEVIPLDD